MAVRALLQQFVVWRWTPSVALVFGALAFAGLAIAVIPDELGAALAPASGTRLARVRVAEQAPVETDGAEAAALEEAPETSGITGISRRPRRAGQGDIVRSIFRSGVRTELPIAPVDPEPPPPPPPPPPVYAPPEAPPPAAVAMPPPGATPDAEPVLTVPVNHP